MAKAWAIAAGVAAIAVLVWTVLAPALLDLPLLIVVGIAATLFAHNTPD